MLLRAVGVLKVVTTLPHLELLVLLAAPVHALPDVPGLIASSVSMQQALSRRCQAGVNLGGDGHDAHILGGFKMVPIIHHQMVQVHILGQPLRVETCTCRQAWLIRLM